MSRESFKNGPQLIAEYVNDRIILHENPAEGLVCIDFCPEWLEWVQSYIDKAPKTCPIEIKGGCTPFQTKVLEQLKQIPFGSTSTYGRVATLIGAPKAARAVGNSCRINPLPLLIPCHRVLSTSGLGGFAYPLSIKKLLLEFESGTVPALA